MTTEDQIMRGKRDVLHQIQAHRVTAQSLDTINIHMMSDEAVDMLYEEVLRGEVGIHNSVMMVEGMKEVKSMTDQENVGETQQDQTATTPGQETTGGTAPLGAEGEPTAAEQADSGVTTPPAAGSDENDE